MLFRYPGNGNSIPSLRTVATSVPLSPTGPPPAFGASVSGCASAFGSVGETALVFGLGAGFASVGVARTGGFRKGFAAGIGISLTDDCAVAGWVTGAGTCDAWVFTSPIARSPGGAATMFTRYIGGSAIGFGWFRDRNASIPSGTGSTADPPND